MHRPQRLGWHGVGQGYEKCGKKLQNTQRKVEDNSKVKAAKEATVGAA